jgi:hypothetical protein
MSEYPELMLERLAGAGIDMRQNGAERWRGACPACGQDDRLTVGVGLDGGAWVKCWSATCEPQAILDVLDLTWSDLRPAPEGKVRNAELRSPDLSTVRPVRWAWRDRVPLAKASLIVGNEGSGKGCVSAYLSARWSRGTLDGDLRGAPCNVLVIGDEDALDDVWTPRLHVAGADLERVKFQHVGDADIDFNDPGDIEHMRGWVQRYEIRVVVFDALLDHVGGAGVDEFKSKAVRAALRPLRRLAADEQIAVIGSMHPRKGRVLSFRDLVANSHQFNAASRSSLLLAPHPEDATLRVLALGKSNHAGLVPTLEFRIEPTLFESVMGETVIAVRAVDWKTSTIDLDAAVRASTGTRDHEPSKTEQAADAILEALADGEPHPSSQIKADVRVEVGCGLRTVVYAAEGLVTEGELIVDGKGPATTWQTAQPNRATGESAACAVDLAQSENPVAEPNHEPRNANHAKRTLPRCAVGDDAPTTGNGLSDDPEEVLRRARELGA